jgi:radical SAM protein with 4Fe4S-binding SPASM domain
MTSMDTPQTQPFTNLMLILTENCNLRCAHCYEQEHGYERGRRMSWATAKQAVDLFFGQLAEETLHSSITFFGGEPSLEFDLIRRVVDYSYPHRTIGGHTGKKHNYVINTNGTLLPAEMYSFFRGLGPKLSLRISVDGYADNHDLVRITSAGQGSWRLVEKNLPLFLSLKEEHGVKVNLIATINKLNYRSIFYDYIHVYELARLPIGFLFVHEQEWQEKELDEVRRQVSMLHEWCMDRGMRFPLCNVRRSANKRGSSDSGEADNICAAGVNSFTVNHEGDIFPCHRTYYYGMGESLRLGNVRTGIVPDQRAQVAAINRLGKLPPKCQECHPQLRKRCHLCFASNQKAYGMLYEVSDSYCRLMRDIFAMLRDREQAHADAMGSLAGKG